MPLTNTCSVSRCGQRDCPECGLNPAQRETLEMLVSEVDDLEVIADLEGSGGLEAWDGWFVFSGENADGPVVGYIKPDGKVSWLTA